MKKLFPLIILILLVCGCRGEITVPDLSGNTGVPSTIFLIDNPDQLVPVVFDGSEFDQGGIAVINAKIGDTFARSITSRWTGSFRWSGTIPQNAGLTGLYGIGDGPLELFNTVDIIPPITRFGDETLPPPEGMFFRIRINGEEIFSEEISREPSDHWNSFNLDISGYSGQDADIIFECEGVVFGTNLAYWGHPEISSPSENPRQVILFGLDTVAAGHFGHHGYRRDTSSNIDELGESSFVFMDAHSPAPWTLPSFASVLSGRLPGVTGANRNNRGLADYEDMLAEIFRRNGFATASFVNIPYLQEGGFYQGMDHMWEVQDFPAEFALTQAKNWIEYHRDQDFFIFIHLFDPHIAYEPSMAWVERFRDPDYSGAYAEEWRLQGGVINANHTDPSIWAGFSEADQIQCEALYDGEIGYMDEKIGEFLNWYESQGMLDDALIAMFGDHGEEFGEHGRWEHGHSQFEEQIHVPMLIKLPRQESSREVNGLVRTIDLYPTLLDLFGFESETESSGTTLLPVLNGDDPSPDIRSISESTLWGPEIKAVTTNDFKYIVTVPTGYQELYDLQDDPGETENVIDDFPDVAEGLGGYLEEYVNTNEAGWHLRFLAGPQFPMTINLRITSQSNFENVELVKQIFRGSGEGITIETDNSFRVDLELRPNDTVEVRFTTEFNSGDVMFDGLIGDEQAVDAIQLGALALPLPELVEMLSDGGVTRDYPDGILVITEEDPVIAFSFPDYAREETRGVFLWTVPENLRAHAAAMTPEQMEALESLGYVFE